MNSVEIKITSQGLEQHQATALSSFLTSLGVSTAATKEAAKEATVSANALTEAASKIEVVEPEIETTEKPKRQRAKKLEVVPQEAIEQEQYGDPTADLVVEEAEEIPQEEAATPSVTLMQIRSLVAAKQANHKDVLRKKLQDLGANNVSTLDPKHFDEFHALLTSLV